MFPLTQTLPNVQRVRRLVDLRGGLYLNGLKFQYFHLHIRNLAGVLQQGFSSDGYNVPTNGIDHIPSYADRLFSKAFDWGWVTLPTISTTVDFGTGGCGIVSGNTQMLAFNTDRMNWRGLAGWCSCIYYDANVVYPRPSLFSGNFSAGSTSTKQYPAIYLTRGTTANNFDINTTNITSGKELILQYAAFVP